jgi:putative transposase
VGADITQQRTGEGWLYLAVILDAFSRRVVGWSMAEHLRTELVLYALDMAIAQRHPDAGLVHHSDHGCQYTSFAFGRRLTASGLIASMGTVGDALDNAVAESFFATLECELLDRYPWPTRAGLRTAIFDFIEVFYNRQRRHSTLDYATPSHLRAAARISSARGLTTVSTKAGQLHSWERCDPSEGSHHILAANQHQTAVHDDSKQLLVGPHGDLLVIRLVDKGAKLAR